MFEKSFRVVDETGFIGTLRAPARFLDGRSEKTIELESGEQLTVRAEDLKVQQDGTFLLLRHSHDSLPQDSDVPEAVPGRIAPVQPDAPVDRISEPEIAELSPPQRSEAPAIPFYADDYDIERVSIGQLLDAPAQTRQEGDTLILPVVEEVLVYQKKILLKEEVRITRRRKPVEQVKRIDEAGATASS